MNSRIALLASFAIVAVQSTPSVKTENGTIVLAAPNVEIEGDGGRRTVATTDMIYALSRAIDATLVEQTGLMADAAAVINGLRERVDGIDEASDAFAAALARNLTAMATRNTAADDVLNSRVDEVNASVVAMNVTLNTAAAAVDALPERLRLLRSLVPRCTSNDCSGGVTIRSSSAHWNHNLAAWKAFNKDTSSWPQGFCLEGRTGWLTIDFPSPVTVTSYKIHGRQDALTYSPKNWVFQGTNGNDAWTTLDTQRNLVVRGPMTATWARDRYVQFELDSPVTYGRFRLLIAGENPTGSETITCIQEMELFGYTAQDAVVDRAETCEIPYYYSSCGAANRAGCTRDGYYQLETDGFRWRTNCDMRSDGGWTEFAYLRWDFQTKNRMRLYTDFPNQWSGRANGGTFVFKGDMAALNGSYVMEGVACPRSTPYERMVSACQWVHTPVAATAAQISSIRDTWGYTSMNGAGNRRATPQICTAGNIFGRGANFTECSQYSHGGHPTTLGWQLDVGPGSHCWAGRGSCCSDSGGSGNCRGVDSRGNSYAMMWVR